MTDFNYDDLIVDPNVEVPLEELHLLMEKSPAFLAIWNRDEDFDPVQWLTEEGWHYNPVERMWEWPTPMEMQ